MTDSPLNGSEPTGFPEAWGTYCPHNVQIVEKDPDRTDCEGCPVGRIVEPWPCSAPGCTRQAFEYAEDAEIEAYEADRWGEFYYNTYLA